MLLADYGAKVIKIEAPRARRADGVARKAWDRGKYSVELDLSDSGQRERLLFVLAGADIFVQSWGTEKARQYGLAYEDLMNRAPRLIYSVVSGYGLDGPHVDRPGFDALVAARWGMMGEQRGHRDGPKFLGHPSIAYGTGLLLAIGALSALRARRVTGRGQQVDVSLLDSVLAQSAMNWWFNEKEVSYLARSGSEPGFGRSRILLGLFPCSDGEYLMMHTGGEGGYKRTMDLLGLGDGVQTVVGEAEMGVPLTDEELELRRQAPAAFLGKTRDQWVKLLHDADLAAIPVLRPGEALDDDQVRSAGLAIELPDPDFGILRQVGPPIMIPKAKPDTPKPAPSVGEHNGRLEELIGTRTDTAEPVPSRTSVANGPLTGVRILDLSSFFAAGYGTKILSDLGADVIKVEPLSGDPMRPLPDPFEAAQRGKRNLALDLRAAEGQEAFRRLVRTADVVVHNLRPGKAERLGVGYDQLASDAPSLIYCYQPGWGSRGPKAHLKSFAPLLSGFCGLLYQGAGSGNPPVPGVLGNEDYYNGFLGAVGVLMGLEHRSRTGSGVYLESPQLHSGLFAMTDQMVDVDGKLHSAYELDPEQYGWGPRYRIYQSTAGYVCVAAVGPRAEAAFDSAVGLADDSDTSLTETAARFFAARSSEDSVALLEAAGVPAEVVREDPFMPDFLWDDWGLETGRIFEQEHPQWGLVREVGIPMRFSDTPCPQKGPNALLGEHNREILRSLGYSDEEVQSLLRTVAAVPGSSAR
jgi:crotonobetainyl-CoA:carnitine CoA-transferase CaiB-like acyl-CoA transferase